MSLKHILYSQVAHKSEKFDINKGIGLKKWTKLDCYLCHQYKSFYVPNIKRHFHKSHPGVSFARELVQKANAVDVTDYRSRRCDAAKKKRKGQSGLKTPKVESCGGIQTPTGSTLELKDAQRTENPPKTRRPSQGCLKIKFVANGDHKFKIETKAKLQKVARSSDSQNFLHVKKEQP